MITRRFLPAVGYTRNDFHGVDWQFEVIVIRNTVDQIAVDFLRLVYELGAEFLQAELDDLVVSGTGYGVAVISLTVDKQDGAPPRETCFKSVTLGSRTSLFGYLGDFLLEKPVWSSLVQLSTQSCGMISPGSVRVSRVILITKSKNRCYNSRSGRNSV